MGTAVRLTRPRRRCRTGVAPANAAAGSLLTGSVLWRTWRWAEQTGGDRGGGRVGRGVI